MEYLRVRNLRSLKDTENLRFKGITILLGENSVGKSTLLRAFPLIKQSIETDTTTPLLWFGNYVDFGSFKESVNRNEKEIIFNFGINFNDKVDSELRRIKYYYHRIKQLEIKFLDIEIHILEGNGRRCNVDYISKLILKINSDIIELKINNDNTISELYINQNNYSEYTKNYKMLNGGDSIIPVMCERGLEGRKERVYFFYDCIEEFEKKLVDMLTGINFDKYYDDDILVEQEDSIERILNNFSINEIENIYEENKGKSKETGEKIRDFLLGNKIPEILRICSFELMNYYKNVYYIAPIRATAERYYRIQNLAVDKVDFQGRNLPVLLSSMSKKEYDKFNRWVEENFNFKIHTNETEGHISINIIKENEVVNISDCGFGYSQILPIIVQLWLLINDKNKRIEEITLLIEQPELHLHPKMQADLIDTFVKCIKINGQLRNRINIIIETHSETIINRLGYLIYKDRINKEDVNIYLFEKDNINQTIVRKSNFDKDGYLENWPIGFFDPREE